MSQNGTRTFLKILLVAVVVICLAGLGVAIWMAQHYKTVIKEKLPGIAARSTNGLYHITFDDISINIFTRTITVHDVNIWHDTAQMRNLRAQGMAPKTYFRIQVPKMEVSDIAWEELIGDKVAGCGLLEFIRPKVTVTHMADMPEPVNDTAKKTPKIERIFADEIKVKNGIFTYVAQKGGVNSVVHFEGGNLLFSEWEYIPKAPLDTTRFLFAKSAVITFKNVLHKKQGWLYTVRGRAIYFEPMRDSLSLTGIKIASIYDKVTFYEKQGKQVDLFDVSFPKMNFSKFNWRVLIKEGKLEAETLDLKNAAVSDYFSRLAPPNPESKYGKFPHQLLMKLKLPVNIHRINLLNATGSYTERSKVTKHAGTLLFTNANGTIDNVTNIEEEIQKNKYCTIKIRGKFMRKSDIAATFLFLLSSKEGAFSVSSYMKNLDAEQIDKTAQALALAEIKSVHVSRMDVQITGNERQASGHFKMQYDDLKITLQKMNDDSTEIRRRGFLSFLANNILLFPSNPMPGEEMRTVNTSVVRDEHKSFFNLIWSNIFEGTLKTVARNEDIINLMQKKDEPQAKSNDDDSKGLFESLINKDEKKKELRKERRQERRERRREQNN